MSYLQPVMHYGGDDFFRHTIDSVKGYIMPDLPFDAPETTAFLQTYPELRYKLIPVLSPNMETYRLEQLFSRLDPSLVYVTARTGITGEHTEKLSNQLKTIVEIIRKKSQATVAVGFGIQDAGDVRTCLQLADIAVVGSSLTEAFGTSEKRGLKLLDELMDVANP